MYFQAPEIIGEILVLHHVSYIVCGITAVPLWHQEHLMHLLEPALTEKIPESIYTVPSIKLHK